MTDEALDPDLEAILHTVQVFRLLDPEMQAQTIAIVLFVACRGRPVLMQELVEAVGLSQSSISRNVASMAERHRNGRDGHRLLESWENPDNRRQKFVALTDRGRAFVKALRRAIRPG